MQIIAIVACVAAAVLGTLSVIMHSTPLQSIVGYISDVWVLGWVIVNKAYTREWWTAMDRPIRELIQRPIPKSSGMARAVGFGMIVLVIVDMVLRFV